MRILLLALILASPLNASFLPSDVSGLVLWLKASSGVAVTSDKVTFWDDSSGCQNWCWNDVDAARPTYTATSSYTGKPAVVFSDAANTLLIE